MNSKYYLKAILVILFSVLILSGCLLTVGSPLAKKIEPGKWSIEGSAGMLGSPDNGNYLGIHGYVYAGHSLGRNFELGFLYYYYKVNNGGMVGEIKANVVALPLKWDPFNYSSPFHLVLFAAPSLFFDDLNGFLLYEGIGLSYDFSFPLELYASYSIPYYGIQLFTGNIGFRYKLFDNFYIGSNFMLTMPLAVGVNFMLGSNF